MKIPLSLKSLNRLLAAGALFSLISTSLPAAELWRLVGGSGMQQDDTQTVPGVYDHPDHTLWEINHYNAAINKLLLMPWVIDSCSIGYCSSNGLVYQTGGDGAYRDNPLQTVHDQDPTPVAGGAFQDNQYMGTINLATRAMAGVYNANPCPNPDPTLPCFGLPAPIPTWVLPQYRRNSTQVENTNRITGPNEASGIRGLAWSKERNSFYVTDGDIYKMTAEGACTKLTNRPAFIFEDSVGNLKTNYGECKAIAFVDVGGVSKMLVGSRMDSTFGNTNGFIIEVDPDTGNVLNQIAIHYPPGGADPVDEFGGLLGLAQHPVTKVLYGVRKTSDFFARELVTIDLTTGNTTLVGNLGMHITTIAFVPVDPWRLVGGSGMQQDDTQTVPGVYDHPDHTLWEINHYNAAINKLLLMPWVIDSCSIGYCSSNGLVYQTGGDGAYRDNPLQTVHDQDPTPVAGGAFQDNQYMGTINLATRAMAGVYNANPCPNPDPTLPCFGLPAPIPTWVLPQYRRNSTQVENTNRITGPNEASGIRGLAWSQARNSFYVTDGDIYKMTAAGDCTKLTNRPAFIFEDSIGNLKTNYGECKAIAFVDVGGVSKMLVGSRMDSTFGNTNGFIIEVEPDTGNVLNQTAIHYPPGGADPVDEFGGLLGLAQHPVTKVLYGVRKTADFFARELVTIDLATGNTKLVGNLGMHITTIAFAAVIPTRIQTITRNGNDINLTWTGGSPPYQVQARSSLSAGSWANIGPSTTSLSATLTNGVSGSTRYFRVASQ